MRTQHPAPGVMKNLQVYRCEACRSQILVKRVPPGSIGQKKWAPPILCCGQMLHGQERDGVPPFPEISPDVAGCPQCGYQVYVLVHPSRPLMCWVCQTEFVPIAENPDHGCRGGGSFTSAATTAVG